MREIAVTVSCDRCDQLHGLRTQATRDVAISLDGLQRRIDLCDVCDKEITALLGDLLKIYGRKFDNVDPGVLPTRRRKKKDKPDADAAPVRNELECPGCGLVSKSRNALLHHILDDGRVHKVGRLTYDACPECGIDKQGTPLSTHRRGAHGWDALAEAKARLQADLVK